MVLFECIKTFTDFPWKQLLVLTLGIILILPKCLVPTEDTDQIREDHQMTVLLIPVEDVKVDDTIWVKTFVFASNKHWCSLKFNFEIVYL